MRLACFALIAASVCLSQLLAQEPPSLEGSWRILCALSQDKEKLDDDRYRDSTIAIKGKRLEWKSADGKETLLAADLALRPSKEKGVLNEVDFAVAKADGERQAFAGIYDLFLPDFLKITFHEGEVRPKGFGGGRQHQYLLLERLKPGAPKRAKTVGNDAERLVGTWTMLTSLDDASDKIRPGPYSGHICVITKDRIEWRTTPKTPTVAADYTIDPTKSPRQMNFLNTKGGNPPPPPDGYLPAIYEFMDDDTLKVCYPESGFKKDTAPKDRPRPASFYSDGNINLWIMKRQLPAKLDR